MGKQYYISDKDGEMIADLLEFEINNLEDTNRETKVTLHWAVQKVRANGERPRASDVDQRLPDPVGELEVLRNRWDGDRSYMAFLVKDIRETRARINRMKALLSRLGWTL